MPTRPPLMSIFENDQGELDQVVKSSQALWHARSCIQAEIEYTATPEISRVLVAFHRQMKHSTRQCA